MTVPLLPKPKDLKDAWPAKQEGFFALDADAVRRRLALSEHLAPEGIASPLAQLHYLTWRLEAQTEPAGVDAVAALRLTVLLQYLGHLAPTVIALDSNTDLGWLAPVLARWWARGEVKNLIVWKIRGLGGPWDGEVFAGSHRLCPLFPGSAFYPDPGEAEGSRKPRWQQVRDALIAARGPAKGGMVDRLGGVASPALAAGLARYLNRFITGAAYDRRGWVVAFETWRNQLLATAGAAQAPADSVLPASISVSPDAEVSFGLYPGTSLLEAWTCAQCRDLGESWTNTPGRQAIGAANPYVSCTRHRAQLRRGNQPVGPADYGAYAGGDGLYVWTEPQAQPPGCTRGEVTGEPGRDGSITYRFNEQQITIQGKLVSLETVLLPTVAWMVRAPGETAKPIDVPVSGAYVGLVDKCEADELNQQWTIKFHGLPEPVAVSFKPEADLWKQGAIVVWPPEERAGWTLDYVAASTPRAQAAGFRLIEETTDNQLVRSPVYRTETLYRTERGVLRYVELGRLGSGDGFESLGLLAVRRRKPNDADTEARGTIALDFGTSNSAVCWRLSGAVANAYGLSGADPAKPVLFMAFNEVDFQSLLSGVDVLAPWNRAESPPRKFVPSLHAAPRDKGRSQPSVPPRGQGLQLLALTEAGTEPRILSGLKWRDWQAPGIRQRVKSLLELVLLPAVWALRSGGCTSATLTASYPLAFEQDKKEAYPDILEEVTAALRTRTGVEIATPANLVSESAAGSSFLPQISVTHVLALDVGGGTTDVVVNVGSAGAPILGRPEGEVLAADSIEYAGRDFLRAVVVTLGAEYIRDALPRIDASLTPPDPKLCGGPEEVSEAYVASLEALVHRRRVEGLRRLMREPFAGIDASQLQLKYTQIIMRWEALLAGLMLYSRRMAEGCVFEAPVEERLSLSFNLFGMGWDLLRILTADLDRHVRFSLESRFRAMSTEMSTARAEVSIEPHPVPPMEEPKTTVVEGALKLPRRIGEAGEAKGPVHALVANLRQTFVGMNLYEGDTVVVPAVARLKDASRRPSKLGDPGYARLIDELFNTIPEFIEGTQQPLRGRVKAMLMESAVYKREWPDVAKHLVELGQDNFNREAWPSSSAQPLRNALAGFLSKVWRPLWSGTRL